MKKRIAVIVSLVLVAFASAFYIHYQHQERVRATLAYGRMTVKARATPAPHQQVRGLVGYAGHYDAVLAYPAELYGRRGVLEAGHVFHDQRLVPWGRRNPYPIPLTPKPMPRAKAAAPVRDAGLVSLFKGSRKSYEQNVTELLAKLEASVAAPGPARTPVAPAARADRRLGLGSAPTQRKPGRSKRSS